jgi:hypothetical protein
MIQRINPHTRPKLQEQHYIDNTARQIAILSALLPQAPAPHPPTHPPRPRRAPDPCLHIKQSITRRRIRSSTVSLSASGNQLRPADRCANNNDSTLVKCMHTCMYECMYECMNVCMYARMHVCMYYCTNYFTPEGDVQLRPATSRWLNHLNRTTISKKRI